MPRIVTSEAAKANRVERQYDIQTPFLDNSPDAPELPSAFLSEGVLGKVIHPHWHSVDQFQIIIGGKGKLGRKDVAPYTVQFVRAYTPYGPITDDGKAGLSFLTLRARFDPWIPGQSTGAQYLPESLDRLKHVANRRPWQITRPVELSPLGSSATSELFNLQEVPDMKDDQGLLACSLVMRPNARTTAPNPASGDGQFLLIVTGSLWYKDIEHKALTIVFVAPKEPAFELQTGAEGLGAIIMNFPKTQAPVPATAPPNTASHFKKWQCEQCAFTYDEVVGLPDDGIPAGTRWEDVPETWTCPDCAAAKSDFQMVIVQ